MMAKRAGNYLLQAATATCEQHVVRMPVENNFPHISTSIIE